MTNAAAQLTIRLSGPPDIQVAGVPLLVLHDYKAAQQAIKKAHKLADVLFTETFERVSKLDFPLEVARTQAAWGETALLYAPAPNHGYTLLATARETFVAHEARGELQAVVLSL